VCLALDRSLTLDCVGSVPGIFEIGVLYRLLLQNQILLRRERKVDVGFLEYDVLGGTIMFITYLS
jgi:hypothetical protein